MRERVLLYTSCGQAIPEATIPQDVLTVLVVRGLTTHARPATATSVVGFDIRCKPLYCIFAHQPLDAM